MAEKKLSIADAFISWHAAEIKASKDGKNPHFRSTYSTLEEVIAACRKAGQHGLTFTQLIDMDDTGRMFVKTIVMHVNGDNLVSRTPIVAQDLTNPQKMGSGITYAKRYGLQAAFGLPSEDDDGNKAAEPKTYKEPMPHNTPKDEPSEY